MDIEVVDAPARSRYELLVDGELTGFADYRPAGAGRVVLPYAQVDPARNGQGLGSALAQDVFEDLRARGIEAVPTCSFMASHLARHPELRE
jgi:predicted GNAT family acetyltransferase